ncbi:hypothetical protein UFOVP1215_19 [uncultured Caudovirales phage]|uniref:Uncharacterized protein n=1 Tax=uncultured Caudovirales phage TaxID=2100421 RepID=A0A6J5R2A6_9CAUD|nr:hypothetical protein UFOVP1215_19 [uncultured Caudovirales phage]
MAHYAYLQNQIVVDVIVGKDETELIDGLDPETYYAQGTPYDVKRTSYNGKIRFNYAGIGYIYDSIRDAFISPKCHDEAIIDEATCRWICNNSDHDEFLPE